MGETELSSTVHLVQFPDRGYNVTFCLKLLPPCLPTMMECTFKLGVKINPTELLLSGVLS